MPLFTVVEISKSPESKEQVPKTAEESQSSNAAKGVIIAENTLLHIFLKDWVPPLITALVGGLAVAIILPLFQVGFETNRANQKRRQEILESTLKNFAVYVDSWRRLRTIAEYELELKVRKLNKEELNKEEKDRKNRYVIERDAARNLLFSDLSAAGIYYNQETTSLIKAFQNWDRDQAEKHLRELPPLNDWENWRDRIVAQMTQEVQVK